MLGWKQQRQGRNGSAAAVVMFLGLTYGYEMCVGYAIQESPAARPIRRTSRAAIHAITHCHATMPTAHFVLSSRFTEAMAATHGVYRRLKTSNEPAIRGVSVEATEPP